MVHLLMMKKQKQQILLMHKTICHFDPPLAGFLLLAAWATISPEVQVTQA